MRFLRIRLQAVVAPVYGYAIRGAVWADGARSSGCQIYLGLENEQLYEKRGQAVATDVRLVLGEVLSNTGRATNLETVFPDTGLNHGRLLNLV